MARTLAQRLRTLPARFYAAAGVLALLGGIGVNALVLQSHRHPAPIFAPAPATPAPAPSIAIPAPPAPPPEAAAPVPVAPPPPPRPAPAATASRSSDQIGNWLRGEGQGDDTHLVVAAQNALVKLGYTVKPDGNEGAATHQALRDFERAHGLPLTTEITPKLVKQLDAAARSPAR